MTQYARSAAPTSDGNYGAQDLSRGPSSATSAGFAGRGAGAYPQGLPSSAEHMPPIPAGVAYGAGAGAGVGGGAIAGGALGMKQREAYQEQQRFRIANENVPGASGAGTEPTSPTGVTVHSDARSMSEDEEPPRNLGAEIPPT